MAKTLVAGKFDIEESFGPLDGYTYGDKFHGSECPYFPKASADKLMAELNKTEGVTAWYDAVRDAYVVKDTHGIDEDGLETYFGEVHEVDGVPTTLYPIGPDQPQGATYWMWDIAGFVR